MSRFLIFYSKTHENSWKSTIWFSALRKVRLERLVKTRVLNAHFKIFQLATNTKKIKANVIKIIFKNLQILRKDL